MEDLNISTRASTGYIRASLGHIFGDDQLIAQGRSLVSQARTDLNAAKDAERRRYSMEVDQVKNVPSSARRVHSDVAPLVTV
ncbi:hypothetical protein K493DRAFT_319576 [Basidiobolus meristosporus CBS 931.73]|uniref:Uncharacterized protein n=1 Tax=Basidiobolus meristosporus CBS 931.73 TaxID=1314790 RepID=A0A1Y1XQP5_9FUNG|nr:hypothetical protein K493DRAFT_319576 [Basidiobolus meristosporus CBS 931.73]|eukprot:ORX88053.1 hypothetical protein K493DRAFT_319576 [Basidiobolus meristosporus CBS 931.73]